jgi:predicted  nucleic acid-binding Zn-ribbon protein
MIEVIHLGIATVAIISSVGAIVLAGWINMRTTLVSLEQKYLTMDKELVEMKSRITNHEDNITHLNKEMSEQRREIVELLSDLKTDVAVIKSKMNNH